jgi:type IV pilus assembly protein PilM
MKLTFAKAEHLKRNAVKSPELKKILASLKTVLNDFVGEVQRSLGYFTNTHRDATIQYMIGLGNAFRLPGLQKYLQEKLQLEVRKLTKLERVTGEEVVAAPTFTENLMSFAVAYGLALQGMKLSRIQTNLLPYEIRVERIVRGKKPWAVAAAAALLLAVAGLTFGYSVEKKGVSNPAIQTEIKRAKETLAKIRQLQGEYDNEVKRKEDAKKNIRRMGAGVEERFNWQRLMQYINMALPRPNGDRLVEISHRRENVRQKYLTPESQKAFKKLEDKRFAKGDPLSAEEEEFIKKYLIQINIEGISALYTEDLPVYLKNTFTENNLLPGMPEADKVIVRSIATNDPSNFTNLKYVTDNFPRSWVVELRGYTYNEGAANFVENTFLENLLYPEGLAEKMTKEMKETADIVKKQIFFMELFKNDAKEQPVPGVFEFISKSFLKKLIKDPKAAEATIGDVPVDLDAAPVKEGLKLNRDNWLPLGDVGSTIFNDPGRQIAPPLQAALNPNNPTPAPTVARQTRIEFVILFVWKEPLPGDAAAAAAAAAAAEAAAAKK